MEPFKAACINKDGWVDYLDNKRLLGPKYGEIVTVIDAVHHYGYDGYVIQEYLSVADATDGYLSSQFVPIIDKKEYSSVAQEILEKFPLHEGPETDVPVKEIVNN